ncbi:MAG: ferredoxin, partial [Christensenellales bacterium]
MWATSWFALPPAHDHRNPWYNERSKPKGAMTMKAYIDRDGCISCGLCAETCPAVFRMA